MPEASFSPPLSGKLAIGIGLCFGTWDLVQAVHRLITGTFVQYRPLSGLLRPWGDLLLWTSQWPKVGALLLFGYAVLWLVLANAYLLRNTFGSWRKVLLLTVASGLLMHWAGVLAAVQAVLLVAPVTRRGLRPELAAPLRQPSAVH